MPEGAISAVKGGTRGRLAEIEQSAFVQVRSRIACVASVISKLRVRGVLERAGAVATQAAARRTGDLGSCCHNVPVPSGLMIVRPSQRWRADVADEARRLGDGSISEDDAFMTHLYPAAKIDSTDAVLGGFAEGLRALPDLTDGAVLALVRVTVLALNEVDERLGGVYETDEREELCEYLDDALEDRGVDVAALMARQGRGRYELTDEWRDW